MREDVKNLKSAVERNMKNYVLDMVLDFGSAYVIAINEKGLPEDEHLTDPFYLVDKKTGKLSGFSPMMDIEKFKKEIKNPLYLRSRDE